MVSYADQNEASPPLGLRTARLSPLSWAPGRPNGVVSYADRNEASPSLGPADCGTVATVWGSWEAQRGGAIRRPERGRAVHAELRTAKLSPLSRAPGKPSGVVSYADHNEASPSLGGCELRNCRNVRRFLGGPAGSCHTRTRKKPQWGLRTAKLSPLSCGLGGASAVVPYADRNEASPSLRPANCETDATFGGSWEAQRGGVRRKPEGGLAVPGGRELRNCRHFGGLLGGPADCCHTQTTMKLRRPWGLRTAKLSPRSWAPGGPSGMVSYADQSEASPSLRGANCEIAATFAGPWEAQRSGVICRPEGGLAVPGWCKLRTCRHVRVLLGGPAKWCHTQTKLNEASPSVGAANCETVATFVGSWEAQRNDFTRKLE